MDQPQTELNFDLEFVLAHLMLKKKDLFFIQIGANDGVTSDPLYKFVTEFGWSGIMVEPMPQAFAALKANHQGNAKLKLMNAALSEKDGTRPLYTVRIDGDTFKKADMYSSFDREVVLRNSNFVPDIADRIMEIDVKTISLDTLLREAGERNVDVLAIDTEGFDYQILKMIDFSRMRPAVICYEHTHLNRADMQAAANLLAAQGYRMTRDNLDTVAYQPSFTLGWKQPA
jgi:FkbM family methyltransferase